MDALIVQRIEAKASVKQVAAEFGITQAAVRFAVQREQRRLANEKSPQLSDRLSVRMQNVLHNAGVCLTDNEAVFNFAFDARVKEHKNLGKKTLDEAQKASWEWLKAQPKLRSESQAIGAGTLLANSAMT